MKNFFKKLVGTEKKKSDCCNIKIVEVQESNECCEVKKDCCETENKNDSCCEIGKNNNCCG